MDLLIDVLIDGVKDTAQLVPFLFLTYLAMEALEHGTAGRAEAIISRADKSGPIVGALLGALPQCGFSAMAATLYAGRVVTAGTLVAVLLSTSDEMVPVFVAHQEPASRLLAVIAFKVVVGMIVGILVDVVLRALHRAGDGHPHIRELCERAHCHCEDVPPADDAAHDHDHAHTHDHDHEHGHGHHHGHDHDGHPRWWHIVHSALIHTVEVTLTIFVISCAFGLLIELVGEETLANVLSIHPVRAIFLAGLIGLIPNCGASVAITELYLTGTLSSGAMIAGLLVSGGVGLLVLFRTNADQRQNAEIAAFIYVVGVLAGLLVRALGIIF
ncbi:MAG: arsenic efflux protein [Atopobiaceae bacterium]|nr:arsenic efflux protein [Atopobiaceae bacterium]